ncbi:ArnA (plasmid) [Candidatus Pantoea soli]|uniref:ArnA n=2 Tax=Candidatus Pantoea soli TaxID=3098669 RepID=A0A518XJN1_9GAMM|nr:ArnA [Pantoea soli]
MKVLMKASQKVKPTVILFGYHDMGYAGLSALIKSGYNVVSVFTHKDSNNENVFFKSVTDLADKHKIPVFRPEDVNEPSWVIKINDLSPDYIITISYRHYLSNEIVKAAKFGAYNVHASLLPAHRGRSHLNWSIIKGDEESGITLHEINNIPDAGPIYAQTKVSISNDDTAHTLHRKITELASTLLPVWFTDLYEGNLTGLDQDESQASSYGLRRPEDGHIDWRSSANDIRNLVRALSFPWPGAFTDSEGKKLIIWKCNVLPSEQSFIPGTVISIAPLRIACGKDILEIDDFSLTKCPEPGYSRKITGSGIIVGMILR